MSFIDYWEETLLDHRYYKQEQSHDNLYGNGPHFEHKQKAT